MMGSGVNEKRVIASVSLFFCYLLRKEERDEGGGWVYFLFPVFREFDGGVVAPWGFRGCGVLGMASNLYQILIHQVLDNERV